MRLILHAGTHKTGTTSIQSALAENREWLHKRGYVFPHLGDLSGHNAFAQRLAQADPRDLDAFRAEIVEVAEADCTLVLSAEEFSSHLVGATQWRFERRDYWDRKRDYLKRLAGILRDFDEIAVFLCFRRHDAFAQSLYATNLLSDRFRWSFAEFRERCAPLFDYRAQVEAFREVFPDVRITPFKGLRHNLVAGFCAWTGIPAVPNHPEPKKVMPDSRLVEWLYHRSSDADDAETFRLRASFARSKVGAAALSGPRTSLWRSERERRDFLECCVDPEPDFFPPAKSLQAISTITDDDLGRIDRAFAAWRQKPRKEKRWARQREIGAP